MTDDLLEQISQSLISRAKESTLFMASLPLDVLLNAQEWPILKDNAPDDPITRSVGLLLVLKSKQPKLAGKVLDSLISNLLISRIIENDDIIKDISITRVPGNDTIEIFIYETGQFH